MHIITPIFDPTTFPPGTGGSFDFQVKNGGFIVCMNMSNVNVKLQFANGATTYVPANDRRKYQLSGQMSQSNTNVSWTVDSAIGVPQSVNRFIVEAYEPGECSPEMYPVIFIRSAQIATTP